MANFSYVGVELPDSVETRFLTHTYEACIALVAWPFYRDFVSLLELNF